MIQRGAMLALVLAQFATVSQACRVTRPIPFGEILAADLIVIGQTAPSTPTSTPLFAQPFFQLNVRETLKGTAQATITISPDTLSPLGSRWAHQPPPSGDILIALTEQGHGYKVLQSPCAGAFLFPVQSTEAIGIQLAFDGVGDATTELDYLSRLIAIDRGLISSIAFWGKP